MEEIFLKQETAMAEFNSTKERPTDKQVLEKANKILEELIKDIESGRRTLVRAQNGDLVAILVPEKK
jgi:hypothetical protein